jgi:hypothetical protein
MIIALWSIIHSNEVINNHLWIAGSSEFFFLAKNERFFTYLIKYSYS